MAVGKTYRYSIDQHGNGTVPDVSLENALQSLDGSSVAASLTDVSDRSYSLQSYENSIDRSEYSLDKSLSSWSRSLDTSFAGGSLGRPNVNTNKLATAPASNVPTLALPTSRRRSKQMKLIRRVTIGVVVLMYTSYFADCNGFANRHDRMERVFQQPMGLPGLIQVLLVFVVLIKLQLLCSMSANQLRSLSRNNCPFLKSKSSLWEGVSHNS